MGIKRLSKLVDSLDPFIPVELHDQLLIIDGNCISCWLYSKFCHSSVLNGDYSEYERCVKDFFSVLKQCRIFAVVILDGAHEARKLKRTQERMRRRICRNEEIETIHFSGDIGYPALISEVFKNTMTDMEIFFCQSVLEADLDILKTAQFLNCPVLSYDSDFYLEDVDYIPFLKLSLDVQRKEADSRPFIKGKLFNRNKFFTIINLHDKSFLPLLSFFLGNDYSEIEDYENFFSQLTAAPKRSWDQLSRLREKIHELCRWMGKFKSPELAVNNFVEQIPSDSRERTKKELLRCLNENNNNQPSYLVRYLHNSLSSKRLPAALEPLEGNSEWMEKALAYVDSKAHAAALKISIPEWIIKKHVEGKLPRTVMDLLLSQNFFTSLQVEQHSLPSVSSRTTEILQQILGIIYHDMPVKDILPTTLFIRNNNQLNKKFLKPAPISSNKPFTFAEIQMLPLRDRKDIAFNVLKIKAIQEQEIMPGNWVMFFLTLANWYRADKSEIAPIALGCLVFSSIFVGVIDKELEYYEEESEFLGKYSKELEEITNERSRGGLKLVEKKDNFPTQNFAAALLNVDRKDCLLALKEFMRFRRRDYSTPVSPELCKSILHCFAQFQTNVIVNEILNSILRSAFESLKIADFYCGTLAYNIYFEIKPCQNLQSFVELKFHHIPTLKRLFLSAIKLIEELSKCAILAESWPQISENNRNQERKRRQDSSSEKINRKKNKSTCK